MSRPRVAYGLVLRQLPDGWTAECQVFEDGSAPGLLPLLDAFAVEESHKRVEIDMSYRGPARTGQ